MDLAGRRNELVDPQKRHVARELEARGNNALERVTEFERRIEELSAMFGGAPKDRSRTLLQLECRSGQHETFPPHILASGRGRCRAAGPLADREGAKLSVPAGAYDRWLSCR